MTWFAVGRVPTLSTKHPCPTSCGENHLSLNKRQMGSWGCWLIASRSARNQLDIETVSECKVGTHFGLIRRHWEMGAVLSTEWAHPHFVDSANQERRRLLYSSSQDGACKDTVWMTRQTVSVVALDKWWRQLKRNMSRHSRLAQWEEPLG